MAEILHVSDPFSSGKCTLCGLPPVALWTGNKGTIEGCRGCAEILPALYADAIRYPDNHQYLERAVSQAKTTFWRALASRLAGTIRRNKT